MKIFSKVSFVVFLLYANCSLNNGNSQEPSLSDATPKSFDKYLSTLSNNLVDSMVKKAKEQPSNQLKEQPAKEVKGHAESLPGKTDNEGKVPKERKLSYEQLTNSYLMGDSDDTSTTNHLSTLISQQKAMQNFRVIGYWVNDLENGLDELRDAVNRRVADLTTGLQRRNQLLGHYNYIGQGNGIGGPGFNQVGRI